MNIFVVHDDLRFVAEVVTALRAAGHDVTTVSDPLKALDSIDVMPRIDVLISRVRFPPGRGNGASLALQTRLKRPDAKVLFTVAPENIEYAEELGEFVVAPIDISELVAMAARLVGHSQ